MRPQNKTTKKRTDLKTWLNSAGKATSGTNPKAPELIARRVLKLSKKELILKQDLKLNKKNLAKLNNLLGKVLAGRPLHQVLGSTNFHSVHLKLNNKNLVPRAETEFLVDYAIKKLPKDATFIDIGTGTGAIGLSIKKNRPDTHPILTDYRKEALSLARRNAKLNHIRDLELIRSNLLKKVKLSEGSEYFFIANLPYLDPRWTHLKNQHLKFEPASTLYSGKNGLSLISSLLQDIKQRGLLTSKNWLLLEHDPKSLVELKSISKDLDFKLTELKPHCSLITKTETKT